MKKIYTSKEERWIAYKDKYRFAGPKPDLEHLIDVCKESSIKKWYPDVHKQITEWIDDNISFREKLYLFKNNIKTVPVCKTCGRPVRFYNSKAGYYQFCCKACSNTNDNKKQLTREHNILKYGGPGPIYSKDVRNKIRATNLERRGVENVLQSKDIYNKSIQTRVTRYGGVGNASKSSKEKYEQTCLSKYGVKNPMSSKEYRTSHNITSPFADPKIQEKCKKNTIEKYGGDPSKNYKGITSCPEVIKAIFQKKKQNKTFNTSNIEKQFENYLILHNINFQTQYSSELYPFNCDFYITDLDLYIEIQASWTHGGHPYDESCDKKTLDTWLKKSSTSKFYANAIDTWTIRDVNKRKLAKQHNLRYLEIFTNDIDKAIEEYEQFTSRL